MSEVIFHMVVDNQNVANSDQESAPRTYFVSADAAAARRFSLPFLTFLTQCWMCRQGCEFKQVIVAKPQGFIAAIANHCWREPDYLLTDTPVKDSIFRALLANDNVPMSAERISEFLTQNWVAAQSHDTSPGAIRRLIEGSSDYYCIVSSESDYGRVGGNGRGDNWTSEKNDEETQVGTPAPITSGDGEIEETETGEGPPTSDIDSDDVPSQPQDAPGETSEGGSGDHTSAPDSEDDASDSVREIRPFERVFFDALTPIPSNAPDSPVILPEGGPKTGDSAKKDTERGSREGRSGAHVPKEVIRWQPKKAAQDLADKFRTMVHSDYDSRCQVCGSTFQTVSGDRHTSVIHVVPPIKDRRTNNLGNLMGLCGKHYDYIRYGEWAMLDPKTNEPFQSPEELRAYFLSASPENDGNGNSYIAVPVRFWNLIQGWQSESPTSESETIRYSIPHWKYLCVLFGGSPK